MRPSMLPTGLESIAYNLNRKNSNLLFFEFGKTYAEIENKYIEKQNLAIYLSGNKNEVNWNSPAKKIDIYFVKGIAEAIFSLCGIKNYQFEFSTDEDLNECITAISDHEKIGIAGSVKRTSLETFSIKQPVYFLSIDWEKIKSVTKDGEISFETIAKFPQIERDLSILIDKKITYAEIENLVKSLQIKKLERIQLFDVFENERLGENKKSFAINFSFIDKEKTLTDHEIEVIMNKIISNLENKLNAIIRRNA